MDKTQLEEEKLNLEIKELKRHWFKKPQYLQALLPTTLAIFSLLFAITSGLFSSKHELLELNKKQLERDITSFQREKDELIHTNNSLKEAIMRYNDSLQDRNLMLRKYENSFLKERQKLQELGQEVFVLKSTKEDYNKKIEALDKEYLEKKERYLKEIESKSYKEIDNEKEIKTLKNTIASLNATVSDLQYAVGLYDKNPFVPANKKFDFLNWHSNNLIKYYEAKGAGHEEELKKIKSRMDQLLKSVDTLRVKNDIRKLRS